MKHLLLVLEFRKFVENSETGKRLKKNGGFISKGTISQYKSVLHCLQQYELKQGKPLNILTGIQKNQVVWKREDAYWRKFEKKYTTFLKQSGAGANYMGHQMKIIKTFFAYLEKDCKFSISKAYQHFRVMKEEKPIVVISPDRLKFLIHDENFTASLPKYLIRTKDILVVGCTVGLRYSDLMALKQANLSLWEGQTYLQVKSQKTGVQTKIRLPEYVLSIIEKKDVKVKLLPTLSNHRLNNNLRKLCQMAGWKEPIMSTRKGTGNKIKTTPFYTQVTSHIMRRTAITTMLTLGMPEAAVRRISGHSEKSASFYRYVQFSQAYLDVELDKVFRNFQRE